MIAAYADGFRVLKDDALPPGRREGRRLPAGQAPRRPTAACCGPTAPARPSSRPTWKTTPSSPTACSGSTPRPATRSGCAQARALTDRMIADFADAQGRRLLLHRRATTRACWPAPRTRSTAPCPAATAWRSATSSRSTAPTGEPRYLDLAGKALDAFSAPLAQTPGAMPLMLVGLEEYLDARPPRRAAPEPRIADGPTTTRRRPVTASARPAGEPAARRRRPRVRRRRHASTIKDGWHIYANPTGVPGAQADDPRARPGLGGIRHAGRGHVPGRARPRSSRRSAPRRSRSTRARSRSPPGSGSPTTRSPARSD